MFSMRRSIRLPDYDYSQPGIYFVTLVTSQREALFGRVFQEGKMELSPSGQIVLHEWQYLKQLFAIELDEFVVMPNHFHAILTLLEQDKIAKNKRNPLGVIIGQFKSRVTRNIRNRLHIPDYPVWQRNYYEHIIRGDKDLFAVRRYIQENLFHWSSDQLYAP